MNPAVTMPGLSSGLDVKAVVNAIADSEMVPKEEALRRQERLAEQELTALGKVFAAGEEFLVSSGALQRHAIQPTVQVSPPGVIDALVTGLPTPGQYSFQLIQAAQPVQMASDYLAPDALHTGTLQISLADGQSGAGQQWRVHLPGPVGTQQLAEAINRQALEHLHASIEQGAWGDQLLLCAQQPGSHLDINVTGSGGLEGLADGFAVIQAGRDYSYLINGAVGSSHSTSLRGAVGGLEINLRQSELRRRALVSVTYDIDTLLTRLDGFISNCNRLLTATSLASRGNAKESLPGSPMVRSLGHNLDRVLDQMIHSDTATMHYRSLADIGISRMRDGLLSVNKTIFSQCMQQHPDSVARLLRGGDSPLTQAAELVQSMDSPTHGLQARGAALEYKIRELSSQHTNLDVERQKITDRLLRKYIGMDRRIGELKHIGRSLEQMRDSQASRGAR